MKHCLAQTLAVPHCINYLIKDTIHVVLTTLFVTMVHGFKTSSTKNVTEPLDLNGHFNMNLIFKPKGPMCINNSALEPVLYEKLHNTKLSHSVFRITTSFQFASTKTALPILLQYAYISEDNLT